MERMRERLHLFAVAQDACWNDQLLPALRVAGVQIIKFKKLSGKARDFATKFYQEQVDPLLTPVTIDPSHPFPRVLNKALCVALLLRHKRKTGGVRPPTSLGVITVPRSLPRLIALPERTGSKQFLLLDDLVEAHADAMFRGYEVLSRAALPRDAQQQPLHAGGRKPVGAGKRQVGASQPPQRRCRASADR